MFKTSIALPAGLGLALAVLACSSVPKTTPKTTPKNSHAPLHLSVAVERSKTEDRWTVIYRLSRPVSELVFDRQVNRFRAGNWISKTSGILIREKDGEEMIVSDQGAPFDTVTFELASYYDMTPKDYEFFQAFSDKSVVMYTGHLNACPRNQDCEEPVDFDFLGRPGDKIVVLGRVETGRLHWTDPTGRGTYVYFGKIKPLQRGHLTAIIDPALPPWLEKRVYDTFPKLFDLYAKETGYALGFKPFIFLNYGAGERDSNFHGGTLPGLIQLSLFGKGWAKENKEGFVSLARFLAHESAHVWNGQLFPYVSKDMWMHEGGADAFAYLALYKLGIVDRKRFLDFQTAALNHCVSQLRNRPLKEVKDDPNFRAHYTCGSMMALITHMAVKSKNKSQDLFNFWNALFTKVRTQNLKAYDEDTYFSTLLEMTGDAELVKRMRSFLNGPATATGSFVQSELEKFGVKFVSIEKKPPEEYQKRLAMDLVRLLMDEDCENRHSVSAGIDGIETEPVKGCRTFTKNFVITGIGRHSVRNGSAAYDSVYDSCRAGVRTIEISVKNENAPLQVTCPKAMPRRAPALGIQTIPW